MNLITRTFLFAVLSTWVVKGQPANGACETAEVIAPSFESTPILTASTAGASVSSFPCGTGNDSPAVFYQFIGNGARVLISTCSDATDFNTELLLEGEGRTCGSQPFYCNTPTSTVDVDCDPTGKAVYLEFFSVPKQLYLLAVQSRDSATTGNFGLTFLEYLRPKNDLCESAALIQPESITFGSTANATQGAFPCGTGNESPAVFYQFLGTGAPMRLSTCSNGTNFNTEILLEGGGKTCGSEPFHCNTPTGTLDIECDPTGRAVFLDIETEMNKFYLVAVQSRDFEGRGYFGLSLRSPGSSALPNTNAPTGFMGGPLPTTGVPATVASPSAAPLFSISPVETTTAIPGVAPLTSAPSSSPTVAATTEFPATEAPLTAAPSSSPTVAATTEFPATETPLTAAPSSSPTVAATTEFPATEAPLTAAPSNSPAAIVAAATNFPTEASSTAAPTNSPSTIDTSGALAKMSLLLPMVAAVLAYFISCVANV